MSIAMANDFDICIVGLKCYDLLAGESVPRYLGGIEKVLVSLAKGLAQEELKVAFITYDHGQPDAIEIDGVTIFKSFGPDEGLPVVRFVHPRMTKVWSTMRRVGAKIYLQMGGASETGVVGLGCDLVPGRPSFIFNIASDGDCVPELPFLHLGREIWLYKQGLSRADLVISQTRKQLQLMSENFSINSTTVPLPVIGPGNDFKAPAPPEPGHARVLWMGRIVETKRLEWLFDIAEACPEVSFDVVGTPNEESDYANGLMQRGESLINVTMHGRVAEEALPGLFKSASLFCSTSTLEGFPTTFLEAWSYGVPVVTTFDPDNLVANNRLGSVVTTLQEQIGEIRFLLDSDVAWKAASQRVRRFYLESFTLKAIAWRYVELIKKLA
jgi:glycosyltransferase involved in cell wall biosynthesis